MKILILAFTLIPAKLSCRPSVVRVYGELGTGVLMKQSIPPNHPTTKDIRFTLVFPQKCFQKPTKSFIWISFVKGKAISIFWLLFQGTSPVKITNVSFFWSIFKGVFLYFDCSISTANHPTPKSFYTQVLLLRSDQPV